jgi:YesN/AraC family two-component response regulator
MIEKTLLCIDDDSATLRALQRSLRGEEYSVLVADTASQAFELLDKENIQTVMVDQRMPEVNGSDLLQQIKARHPNIIRLVLSGYADASTILESINEGEVYRFLVKPWNGDELKITLNQCFEHHELQRQNRELLQTVNSQNEALVQLNDELKSVLENRTYLLRLVQEVVQHIPLPLVALDLTGQIVTANTGFIDQMDNKSVLGSHIEDLLPVDVASQIQHLLQQPAQRKDRQLIDGGALGGLEVVPFNFDDEIRGAIVILSPKAV